MRRQVIDLILGKCLAWREGEAVLVVSDTIMEPAARAFQRAAAERGVEVSLVSMTPRRAHGEEPTRAAAEAMKSCPVAVLLTTRSLTHTAARREACEAHGVRIASMPGADVTRLEHLLNIDYDELRARTDELARHFEAARTVRLTSPAGTDLRFEIGGRAIVRDTGDLGRPGAFGNLPAGAVEMAPVEGTADGIVIIDGSITGSGRLKEPVAVRFAGGRAVQLGSAALQELLQPHGPDAFKLAGFGIGTNPRATLSGNLVEDEKALGIAHLSFGANTGLGGTVQLPVHASALLLGARVDLDGSPLPDRYLTPAAPSAAPDLAAIDLAGAETYRILFENSNDPQAVIDLDTQRFLEVNDGFERLSGFTREDLLDGAVAFSKLVARESYPTYLQKRETRRINPAERYDLKLQAKLGEKKPVELSVRLVKLTGRDVVLVSARDLSQRKKIEQEMWAKIEELGHSNNRIYALTEKIRKVPELTPQLLHITDEEALLERTAELLCARDGLAYADVTFYLLREDVLELAYSTVRTTKRKMRLSSDHRLVRVARGEDPGGVARRDAVLPLKGRERNIGVMEVAFHPKEIEVLEGNERAIEGYHDLLKTLTNVVGLLVENLHLYETVKRQAVVDGLTGTFNRRFFDTKIAEETHRAARYGRHLTLLMIDIDHFADVNSSRGGHPQGDVILVEIGRALRSQTRDVDSVCRYGGDEFAVLMPETPYAGGLGKAELLRRAIESLPFPDVTDPKAKPLRATLSIGVAGFHPGIKDADGLLKAADAALYEAKAAGRNAVRGRFPDGPSIPP